MDMAMKQLHRMAQQSGADAFDIVGRQSESVNVSVFQGKVQQTEISSSVGIGIRVFRNGCPGYASTERLTEESLAQTLRDALSHCDFTSSMGIELPSPVELPVAPNRVSSEVDALELEQMAQVCFDIEKHAQSLSSEIENIPHLGFGVSRDKSWFANQNGVQYFEDENSFGVGIGAVALRNEVRKMGVYNRGGRDLTMANAQNIANMAVERALELLDAKPIAGGDMPIVVSDRVSASLLGMFFSSFYAEAVQKGQSRFAGKMGEKVASSLFHLSSDPLRWDLPGATLLDAEGVPTRRVELVKEGVLTGFLHNLETAARDGVQSTGSASRGYSGRVGTSFHNAIVATGTYTELELLKLFPRCLHIVKLEGASGCSSVSGEISIGVQGFLVENGVRIQAVDGVTISSNFFDLLPRIVGFASTYNDSFSSVKVPAFAVESVSVSG